MNSLFTIAVFVGLSLTILGQCNLENRSFCDTDVDVPKKVIVLEVLLPLLIAGGTGAEADAESAPQQGRRQGLPGPHQPQGPKACMVGSAIGSVMGCLFLGGLPMYVSTRGLYCMKPPTIIVPISVKEDAEKLFEIHRKMDQSELKHNLIGLDLNYVSVDLEVSLMMLLTISRMLMTSLTNDEFVESMKKKGTSVFQE
ncbi:tRNase Z TRZ1 [Glycine soja]